jgi:hypothetical protein
VRRIFLYTIAGLLSALGLLGAPAHAQKAGGAVPPGSLLKEPATSCGNYGTAVQFVKTPSEAARQALKEEKLVFVLHVSGLFEDPDFT